MTPRIIGISGKIGSSKNTLAQSLAENMEQICYHIQFSEPIKRFLEDISGIRRECTEYGAFVNPVLDFSREQKAFYLEDYGMTVGEFMQEFGADCRDMMNFMFVNGANHKIEKALEKGYTVIISDVRYENEAEYITANDGIVVRLEGTHDDSRDPNHESEVELDDFEFSYTTTIKDDVEKEALKIIRMFGL